VAKIRMPAERCGRGIFSRLTHRPTSGRLSTPGIQRDAGTDNVAAKMKLLPIEDNPHMKVWMPAAGPGA
jgi:hypothetical protein